MKPAPPVSFHPLFVTYAFIFIFCIVKYCEVLNKINKNYFQRGLEQNTMSANQSYSPIPFESNNQTMAGVAPDHPLSGNQILFLFTKTSVSVKFTIIMLMFLIGTPGNGFMAYVVWKTPQLRSQTNILLAWLTISDMLAGSTTTLFVSVYQFIIFVLSNDPCHFITLIEVSFTFLKIPNYFAGYAIMICIAIDRFVAVVYPFHYGALITERWAKVSLVISWCFGFFVGFLRHLSH